MIGLLPVLRLMIWVAVSYGVAILIALGLTHAGINLSYAFSGASVLYVLLFIISTFGWKFVWRHFPILNRALFPLIEGDWDIAIHWGRGPDSGVVEARATIKQSLMRLSMEVASKGSDSETLVVAPRKDPESGTPQLYYVYRVTPRLIEGHNKSFYLGTAILRFFHNGKIGEMRGNYFTSAGTQGHFELRKKAMGEGVSVKRGRR
jgi:hypothetical protein